MFNAWIKPWGSWIYTCTQNTVIVGCLLGSNRWGYKFFAIWLIWIFYPIAGWKSQNVQKTIEILWRKIKYFLNGRGGKIIWKEGINTLFKLWTELCLEFSWFQPKLLPVCNTACLKTFHICTCVYFVKKKLFTAQKNLLNC